MLIEELDHQDMLCTRHLIDTIWVAGMIFPLYKKETEVQKSFKACLKTQKKMDQDLTSAYDFQVCIIAQMPGDGRVNENARDENQG